ncbi:RNA polymerase binding protein RbpA [Antricoccus suffuscus]|uniref:RNA polymerase-binding protein RbpA n=1 Tax=Antricoccus suffuscus TaxID=1629062 RepID=A0A2T0ZWG9_9ACTN|nr:RNA polymerase-binding protein RbpA [Antricoccus suffuscus]PRZ40705.1 RNA polymerase binding protein RbpA [Antricoccus suffuscus]
MAERTLRGSRLGSISYETDRNFEPVARVMARYECPNGHITTVPFADDAETPLTWECRYDGVNARLIGGGEPEAKKVKPPRTHWDMLMERRTIADLEEVLAERLEVLAARRGGKSSK